MNLQIASPQQSFRLGNHQPIVCQGGRNTLHQNRTNHVTQTGDRKLPENEKANNCLSTNKGSYATHLRMLAQAGGSTTWDEAKRVVELVLLGMFKQGFHRATLRGCVSAIKACSLLTTWVTWSIYKKKVLQDPGPNTHRAAKIRKEVLTPPIRPPKKGVLGYGGVRGSNWGIIFGAKFLFVK